MTHRMLVMSFDVIDVQNNNATNVVVREDRPQQNPALLYLMSLSSQQSREVALRTLNLIARLFKYDLIWDCPWEKLTHAEILYAKTVWENEGKTPNTINLRLAILKGVAKQSWSASLMSDHDYMVIKAMKSVRGSRLSKGRALTHVESSKLVSGCEMEDSPKGIRDAAILALGLGCGLRRAEIAGIKCKDIDAIEHSISIIGKGNKERKVFCSEPVWARVEQWMKLRNLGSGCEELFCAVIRGGHIREYIPITEDAIYNMLRKRGQASNVAQFAPHDLRRTFATRLFASGADANLVRQAMGHASIATTQKYDKRGDDQLKKIVESISL